jgi:hypothetical protein
MRDLGRLNHHEQARESRLKRLAADIDALAKKDERRLDEARSNALLRKAAAAELHAICADFVASINALLARPELNLDPPDFSEEAFSDEGVNLIQVNVRGRILQIEFEASPGLVSTEDFRIPYTLEGSVRAFNQELLDQDLVEEQLIFYTLQKPGNMWRFFDPRTYRSGPFDQDYLVALMEQLV